MGGARNTDLKMFPDKQEPLAAMVSYPRQSEIEAPERVYWVSRPHPLPHKLSVIESSDVVSNIDSLALY